MSKKTLEEKFDEYFRNGTDPFCNRMNASSKCHVELTKFYRGDNRNRLIEQGCQRLKDGSFDLVSHFKEKFGKQAYCYNIWGKRRYCWTFETHDGRFRSAIVGANGKGMTLETDCSATDEEALEIWRLYYQKVYGTTFEEVNVDKLFEETNG
jgi:hypothetical protein